VLWPTNLASVIEPQFNNPPIRNSLMPSKTYPGDSVAACLLVFCSTTSNDGWVRWRMDFAGAP
jgi:hypothetical protein